MKRLRVWWIPQVPGKAFNVEVKTVGEGARLILALGAYDQFQLDNNIKPDYANAGGLEEWCAEDEEWCTWYDEEGEDDPLPYVET